MPAFGLSVFVANADLGLGVGTEDAELVTDLALAADQPMGEGDRRGKMLRRLAAAPRSGLRRNIPLRPNQRCRERASPP